MPLKMTNMNLIDITDSNTVSGLGSLSSIAEDCAKEGNVQDLIPQKKKWGKPVHPIWQVFTEQKNAHQVITGKESKCKHCGVIFTHHNKTANVHSHLSKCKPFVKIMNNTEVSERPKWWGDKSYVATPTKGSSSQSDMRSFTSKALTSAQLELLHEKVAMHYYLTCTSFARVEEKHLLEACRILNPTVVLPNRKKLGGILLDRCYSKLKEQIDEQLNGVHNLVCITSDCWTNILSEPIITYMAINEKNSLFLESVSTAEESHTANWISEDMERIFDSSNSNIVGAVTDNTAANKKAWGILQGIYPELFFHGCICHGLHLIVKDIFALEKRRIPPTNEYGYPTTYPFEELLLFTSSCKDIVNFFSNHHLMCAKLKKALNNAKIAGLVSPGATRWGSILKCFQSILKAEPVLNAIVLHHNFEAVNNKK